jgi:four helix bundle protein
VIERSGHRVIQLTEFAVGERNYKSGLDDHSTRGVAESNQEVCVEGDSTIPDLPHSPEAHVLGKQLLRAGTSVGANYRAAGRARSKAEFIAKIGIVLEEADETIFWLECLAESGIVKPALLSDLLAEANELVAIFVASQRTARESK